MVCENVHNICAVSSNAVNDNNVYKISVVDSNVVCGNIPVHNVGNNSYNVNGVHNISEDINEIVDKNYSGDKDDVDNDIVNIDTDDDDVGNDIGYELENDRCLQVGVDSVSEVSEHFVDCLICGVGVDHLFHECPLLRQYFSIKNVNFIYNKDSVPPKCIVHGETADHTTVDCYVVMSLYADYNELLFCTKCKEIGHGASSCFNECRGNDEQCIAL